jgi:outer membrane receptor protein involved in Fe transport
MYFRKAWKTADAPGRTEHQTQVRSTFGLRSNLAWDTSVYFVGQLTQGAIPAYTRLDTQLRWRVLESVEFSVTGQNLLTARHPEFGNTYGVDHTEVLRSVLGKVTWKF